MINYNAQNDIDDTDDYYVDKKREKNARLHDAMAGVVRPHLLSKDEIHDAVGKVKEKGRKILKREKEIVNRVVKKEREVVGKVKEKAKRVVEKEREILGKVKEKAKRGVEKVKEEFDYLKRGAAEVEKGLLEDALGDFEGLRNKVAAAVGFPSPTVRGFVVLGMHRSGTSMLAGLLVQGFGYHVGEPLIQPNYDNKKGFFELIPAVLQNDVFMYDQGVSWDSNVRAYDSEKALVQWMTNAVEKKEGQKALSVLNKEGMTPWLQKDPRMCITLRTWLPLLAEEKDGGTPVPPAVVFTYRHPLEVAMSLNKRQSFELYIGLRLWILYNELGVKNSQDLCRVQTSNTAVLADPMKETNRIVRELTDRCHVAAAPVGMMPQEVVNDFVDPKLQGNRKMLEEKMGGVKILERRNGGECLVKDFESKHKEGSAEYKKEMKMYMMAMKVYCDFESGEAYNLDYQWPIFD